jgi:hypothetical protein
MNGNLYCRFGNKNGGVVRLAGSFSQHLTQNCVENVNINEQV